MSWFGGAVLIGAGCLVAPMPAGASPGQSVTSLAGGGLTAQQLAESLVGNGVTISNVQYTGDLHAAGEFTGMSAVGIASGVALSSGSVVTADGHTSSVVGPNENDYNSTGFGTPGDSDLNALIAPDTTNDAAVLEFDFVPTGDQVSFNYVFGSDEYNEYIGEFNDVFGFFVNGQNCATIGNPPEPISVNNVNGSSNSALYRDNDPSDAGQPSIDAQMDGLTTVLTCAASVNPGVTNHLKLAIADAVDTALDSDVFIAAGSLRTNRPPTAYDDFYSVASGSTLTGPAPGVLANDTDPDLDPLTVDTASVSSPAHGSLSIQADGSFTYQPVPGYAGPDSFTYKASDGAVDSSSATVSITVTAVSGPSVNAGADVFGQVGDPIPVNGSSQGTTSTSWSFPAGTPCSIAEPAALTTTVTCTTAGTYPITLTGSNGSVTVSDSAQVQVLSGGLGGGPVLPPSTTQISGPRVIRAGHRPTVVVGVTTPAGTVVGSVELLVNGSQVVTLSLLNGKATFTLPPQSRGIKTITARFLSGGNAQTSTADTVIKVKKRHHHHHHAR